MIGRYWAFALCVTALAGAAATGGPMDPAPASSPAVDAKARPPLRLDLKARQITIDAVEKHVAWGAGPRASQDLVLGAKTWAALNGSVTPSCDDVRRVARPCRRRRGRNVRTGIAGLAPIVPAA